MKADDLKIEELVDFSEGRVSLHGRRLVISDLRSWAQFCRDLLEMVGPDQTRRILTRFGYFWGQADAAAMERIFEWETVQELLKAMVRLQSLQGLAKAVLKELHCDPATGRFEMKLTWHDSGPAGEYLAELGTSEQPTCWILTGYASGYASYCLHEDVYFIEEKCRTRGDRICQAVGRDRESWSDEIKPHLPYFQGDDIQGKIRFLTDELRRKGRELARQRRQLGLPPNEAKIAFVEVRSQAFRQVMDLAARIAPFDSSVLITGETGTGKEVMARYMHRLSRRASGPLLGVNCSALPETLLESELFGHKAGAFTGASQDRVGLFEQAGKGTIFLDEIGDISPGMQMKLLRVLQEREVQRVGESKPRKIDVRVIAATNRDLQRAVAEGKFREDLYFRIRVIEIELPPLRSRTEDILPLARNFVIQFSKKLKLPHLRLDATCVDYLQAYRWPGNVRELENALERAAVLCKDQIIRPEDLPRNILQESTTARPGGGDTQRSLAQVEQEHILAVLESTGGNRSKAAQILEIGAATLWRKLKEIKRPGGKGQ